MSVSVFSLPFNQQQQFFAGKANLTTESWLDVYGSEHNMAFAVAGANRNDLLADLRTAVEQAIVGGTTLETFRRDFTQIVEKYGWEYNGGFSWRTRTIYETNLRSSYQAGRYTQLMSMKDVMPYWQYHHSDSVQHPRLQHLAWNNLVLSNDDPFWKMHFPPNGWGCHCTVTGLTAHGLKAMGKTAPDPSPNIQWVDKLIGGQTESPRVVTVPDGIDPSFEHIPGASRFNAFTPSLDDIKTRVQRISTVSQPLPKKINKALVASENLSTPDAVKTFLSAFSAVDDAMLFKDKLKEVIVISQSLFNSKNVMDVVYFQQAFVHGNYAGLIAEAIKSPSEIWLRIDYDATKQTSRVVKRYIALFDTPSGEVLIAVDWSNDTWQTIVETSNITDAQVNQLRIGKRAYERN